MAVTAIAAPTRAVGPGVRASRTARRLAVTMVLLVGLGLAAGVSGVTSVQSRAALIDDVTGWGGPLVVTTQNLYRYLSDADATAASAFLTDGPEPPELRERYQHGIANAGAALARVSSGVHDGRAAEAVAVLSVQLPVYTGLVETARAYHRQGLPVGAAYLREASGIMREQLLPAAERLFEAVSGELDEARAAAGGFPTFAILLGLVTLGWLVLFQVFLARRTRRVFNIGLVLATCAALTSVLWLTASWASSVNHLADSDREGSAQVALLAEARIVALQARGDEAHTLLARGAGASYEDSYQTLMAQLSGPDGGLLSDARQQARRNRDRSAETVASEAIAAAQQWQEVHAEVRRLDDVDGDHSAAVAAAIGPEPDSAASAAARLDQALAQGITRGSDRLGDAAGQARAALNGVGLGLGLLTALLLIGVLVGIQQRLAEYR